MKYQVIRAFDCPSAWFKTLYMIWSEGDIFEVGYGSETAKTKKLNISIEISHPEMRPLVHDKAPCNMEYIMEYALSYLWVNNEDDDSSYTYGSRLRDPVDQIEELLNRYTEETNDRQIVLLIRRPSDILKEFNDPPCLTIIDTEVTDGKLHLTSYLRSWDCYGGIPANIGGIQLINEGLVNELNRRGLSVDTGKLIFHSKNAHIYERQFPLVKKLFKNEDTRYDNIEV